MSSRPATKASNESASRTSTPSRSATQRPEYAVRYVWSHAPFALTDARDAGDAGTTRVVGGQAPGHRRAAPHGLDSAGRPPGRAAWPAPPRLLPGPGGSHALARLACWW